MRHVKQCGVRPGMTGKDRRQHIPSRPANVDDGVEGRKIVSGSDGWRLLTMKADHCLTEKRRVIGMLRKVLENRHAVRLLKAGFAGLHRVDHVIQALQSPS